MINIKENENLDMLNHSCAHLLAHAVKHLYPEVKFWVGPATTGNHARFKVRDVDTVPGKTYFFFCCKT